MRDILPWKSFENLHTVVAILALFAQFLSKFYFGPKVECFSKYDAFCSYIFDCVFLHQHCQQVEKKCTGKFLSFPSRLLLANKNFFKTFHTVLIHTT